MSRKPFSEVTESYFRNEMREPLVRGHDNRSAACLLANAAIAQDKEYALRRIREENHEGMIYYRERDEARAERDALREENEKLREQCDRYDHIIPSMAKGRNDFRSALKKTRAQLAEAVKVIEMIDARELNLEHSWSRRILEETAREFLAKVKA